VPYCTVLPHHLSAQWRKQKASVTQWIGLTSVTITYNGPDVHNNKGNNRKGYIWGELVPYGFNDPGGYAIVT